MICIVLAAGYATRLYPLTENFPKPLLEIKGKTILDWLIDDIASTNAIQKYVVVTNDKYYNHFINWEKGKELDITVLNDKTTSNENRLGAVRDIQFAIEELKLDDDLFIIAGDNVLDFSFKGFISYFLEKKASCIMRYYERSIQILQKCGVIEIDNHDLILNMEEKPACPKSNWAVPPFYIYHKNDIKYLAKGIKEGCKTDAPGSFIVYLCKKVKVFAMLMSGKRYDIGDIESYEKAQNEYGGINGQ